MMAGLRLSTQFQWALVALLFLCLLMIHHQRSELRKAIQHKHRLTHLLQLQLQPAIQSPEHTTAVEEEQDQQAEQAQIKENQNQQSQWQAEDTYEDTRAHNVKPVAYTAFKLVLFTTFTNLTEKRDIHQAVLKNWALLGSDVLPVLFTSYPDDILCSRALEEGWRVLPVPDTNQYGTPVITAMFQQAHSTFHASFYGYANGDILFSDTLMLTLTAVSQYFSHTNESPVVLVGSRKDYKFEGAPPEWIMQPGKIRGAVDDLPYFLAGQDFFIMGSNPMFPWDTVPRLVVGRSGVDSYLINMAAWEGMNLVEITHTVSALHLLAPEGTFSHLSLRHPDSNYNMQYLTDDNEKMITQMAVCQYETIFWLTSVQQVRVRKRTIQEQLQELPSSLRFKYRTLFFQRKRNSLKSIN